MTHRISVVLGAAALFSGCLAYEPAPLDPERTLVELEAHAHGLRTAPDASTPLPDLVRTTHPSVRAARLAFTAAVARAEVAGLHPDPELGWDAMGLLAAGASSGSNSSADVVGGLELLFPLRNFGAGAALDARLAAEVRAAGAALAVAERDAVRAFCLASAEHAGAAAVLAAVRAEEAAALDAGAAWQAARQAGAATDYEVRLAAQGEASARAHVLRAEAELARSALGLEAALGARLDGTRAPALPAPHGADRARHGLRHNPELLVLAAAYGLAEADLQLAVARQGPSWALGTGLRLTVPVFSGWGRPAVGAARAARDAARAAYVAGVQDLRMAVERAVLERDQARAALELLEGVLLPAARATEAAARDSRALGALPVRDALAASREPARLATELERARLRLALAEWRLAFAACDPFASHADPTTTR